MRLHLKASELLKHNIDALLQARGQSRADLARYCRRSRSWMDKIFSEERREVPLKYLDQIADFFAIATYQLFQPGISPLTERRSGQDRRAWRDRRISRAVLSQKPGDVDLVDVARALSRQGREQAIRAILDILNDELRAPRNKESVRDHTDQNDGTDGPTRARKKKEA